MECDTISKITFEISEDLLLELMDKALDEKSSPEDLIERFIRQGLKNQKGPDTMAMVSLNETVMEKVNIESKLTNKTPNEVINDVLWDALGKIEDIPDEFDAEKIWDMLEHDKPEGDDVLDRITDLFD